MRECKRCGGSALRDYAYGCDHVFDDTPSPLVEVVEVRGESVYHASHNGAAPHVLHPGEVGVREGWREAWRDKAIEDAQARDREAFRGVRYKGEPPLRVEVEQPATYWVTVDTYHHYGQPATARYTLYTRSACGYLTAVLGRFEGRDELVRAIESSPPWFVAMPDVERTQLMSMLGMT